MEREWGDVLDERYLIDRAEHEAHAEDGVDEPDLDEPEDARQSLALLPLIDAYVARMRKLPEDAADDESRYGDSLEIAGAMRAEIERRLKLAETDHSIMWRSHLDNNESSQGRQQALLHNAKTDKARGRTPGPAAEHVHQSIVDEWAARQ